MNWVDSNLSEDVLLKVSKAAAVVMFEYLERCSDEEKLGRARPVMDVTEANAFNELDCAIERVVPDIFSPRYSELIAAAKRQLTAE
jgi:hypothetical protein